MVISNKTYTIAEFQVFVEDNPQQLWELIDGTSELFVEGDVLSGGDVLPGFVMPVRDVFDV